MKLTGSWQPSLSAPVVLPPRVQGFFALALCAIVLNALLAYVNIRRLDGRVATTPPERAERISRAIALQALGGLFSVAMLIVTFVRVQHEQRARLRVDEVLDQFGATLDQLGDAVLITDAQGRVEFVNRAASSLSGWGPDEALGQPVTQVVNAVVPHSRLPADAPALRAIRENRGTTPIPVLLLRTRGEGECLAEASATPLRARDGSVVGAALVLCGARSRRGAPALADPHAQAERQSDQFGRLADIANLVYAAQDVRSVLGVITAGAREITQARRAAAHVALGPVDGFVAEAESPWPPPAAARAAGTSGWLDAPAGTLTATQILTGDDLKEPRWRAFLAAVGHEEQPGGWLGAPLVGRDGRHLGVLHLLAPSTTSFSDDDVAIVTHLARVAASAIENAWLYEELREGDRRKDEFLATLAHELRNPLAPMNNVVAVLKRAPNESVRGDALSMLERQLKQMVRLIDDLLDISRITKGKLELRSARVDLAAILRAVAESARAAIDEAGHTLVLSLPFEPVILQADEARLSQVFANLVNNATKYSEPGGYIEVTLETTARAATVRVRDAGIGIAPEMLPRVFDMFAQADYSVERARGGLGIGLTLVRSIVELHGGRVEAASEGVGHGSTFTVHLPLSVATRRTTEHRIVPPTATGARQPRRVLVVDDNVDAAESLSMLLSLEGHDVRVVHDGPAALREAASFEPALVLLDIGLPGLSGYDVARALRGDPRTTRAVIVALTGWGQEVDRSRSRDAGFDHHLVKPLDIEVLNRVIA